MFVSGNTDEQGTEMASSKYKSPRKKKLNPESHMSVSNLRKENVNLKKTLVELSRQHSEHNKLLEVNFVRLLSQIICAVTLVFTRHESSCRGNSHCTINSTQPVRDMFNLFRVVFIINQLFPLCVHRDSSLLKRSDWRVLSSRQLKMRR